MLPFFLENKVFWQNLPISSPNRSVDATKDKVSAASEWGQLRRTNCLQSSESQRALAAMLLPKESLRLLTWVGMCPLFWFSCKFPNESRTRFCKLVEGLLTGHIFLVPATESLAGTASLNFKTALVIILKGLSITCWRRALSAPHPEGDRK